MHFNDFFDDAQSQACAWYWGHLIALASIEAVEEVWQIVNVNAAASILDCATDGVLVNIECRANVDFSLWRVVESIRGWLDVCQVRAVGGSRSCLS